MFDLEQQLHEYAEFLHSDARSVPPGDLIERGTPSRRVTPMRGLALAAGTAILILAVVAAVLIASLPGEDRPVIEPVTTLPVVPTTAVTVPAVVTPAPTITWTRVADDGSVFGGEGEKRINVVESVGFTLVAGGFELSGTDRDAALWLSSDGTAWSRVSDHATFGGPGQRTIRAVAGYDSRIVAVGYEWSGEQEGCCDGFLMPGNIRPAAWVSEDDGVTWLKASFAEQDRGRMLAVIATENGFIAGGDSVWVSSDGVVWTDVGGPKLILDLAEIDGDLIAVGETDGGFHAGVWQSSDGVRWTPVQDGSETFGSAFPFFAGMESIVNGPFGLVAVGYGTNGVGTNAAAWTSPDGEYWAPATAGDHSFGGAAYVGMHAVVAHDGQVIAVGDRSAPWDPLGAGLVWVSDDGGLTWTRPDDPDMVFGNFYKGNSGLTSVTVFGDRIIAAGYLYDRAAIWTGTLSGG